MLLEEAVAEPVVEGRAAGLGEQAGEHAVAPGVAERGSQKLQDPLLGGRLAPHRGDADDAVAIREGMQGPATPDPLALLVGQLHARALFGGPAVARQAGDGDLKHGGIGAERAVGGPLPGLVPDHRSAGVAVEDPLGGIVGVGAGEAVRIFSPGCFGPVVEIEGNLRQRGVGDLERLVDAPYHVVVFGG